MKHGEGLQFIRPMPESDQYPDLIEVDGATIKEIHTGFDQLTKIHSGKVLSEAADPTNSTETFNAWDHLGRTSLSIWISVGKKAMELAHVNTTGYSPEPVAKN